MHPALRDRLRSAVATGPSVRSIPPRTAGQAPVPIDLPLGGCWYETPHGPVYLVERRFSLSKGAHGAGLAAAARASPRSLPVLGGEDAPAGLRDAAFLDIETTSLSGGVGTYAFLVGVGTFQGDEFVVRQLFVPTPDHEPAMLSTLVEQLRPLVALVSYNGKGFDVPILEGRLVFHRLRCDLRAKAHLDLLHPARRLYRGSIGSCRLAEIEAHVLGVTRSDDVPSQEIPARYFHYLRTGLTDALRPVLRHNAQDVLSLALLVGRLAGLVEDGAQADGRELAAVARLLEARARFEEAAEAYRRALGRLDEGSLAQETMGRLGFVLKRLRRWEEATSIWRELASRPDNLYLHPWVELAKHYEHRAWDLATALEAVERGVSLVRGRYVGVAPAWSRARLAELEHRRRRIEGKMRARTASTSP